MVPRSNRTTRLLSFTLANGDAIGVEDGHRRALAQGDGGVGDAAVEWEFNGFGGDRLAVAGAGPKGVAPGAEILEGVVILDTRFIADGLDEGPIAADVVDPARIPDLAHLIGGEQVRQQLDVVPVRVAQDEVIDGRQRRRDGLEVGQHPVARSPRQVVVRAAVVHQGEVGTAHQDAQPGAHIHDIDGEGRRRRTRHDLRPAFGDKPLRAIGQLDAIPAGHRAQQQRLVAGAQHPNIRALRRGAGPHDHARRHVGGRHDGVREGGGGQEEDGAHQQAPSHGRKVEGAQAPNPKAFDRY